MASIWNVRHGSQSYSMQFAFRIAASSELWRVVECERALARSFASLPGNRNECLCSPMLGVYAFGILKARKNVGHQVDFGFYRKWKRSVFEHTTRRTTVLRPHTHTLTPTEIYSTQSTPVHIHANRKSLYFSSPLRFVQFLEIRFHSNTHTHRQIHTEHDFFSECLNQHNGDDDVFFLHRIH